MCECPGYVEDRANICKGCDGWRKKYGWPLDKPCTENIGTVARNMDRNLCHYCNVHRMNMEKAARERAHSSPPQSPPPGTPGQAAHSSPPQSPPPWQAALSGAATPQLEQICARLDALEEACGRMETMMVAMVNAFGVDQQVAQALAQPPGLALAQPVALMQAHAQAAGPVQAQALGQLVSVNNN